jgi:hypothetical protein
MARYVCLPPIPHPAIARTQTTGSSSLKHVPAPADTSIAASAALLWQHAPSYGWSSPADSLPPGLRSTSLSSFFLTTPTHAGPSRHHPPHAPSPTHSRTRHSAARTVEAAVPSSCSFVTGGVGPRHPGGGNTQHATVFAGRCRNTHRSTARSSHTVRPRSLRCRLLYTAPALPPARVLARHTPLVCALTTLTRSRRGVGSADRRAKYRHPRWRRALHTLRRS